jgi:hypothetical protein
MTCPICANEAMRAEIEVCPICGQPGAKAELGIPTPVRLKINKEEKREEKSRETRTRIGVDA